MHAVLKIGFYLDKPLLPTLNTAVCRVISNRFVFRVTAVTLAGELDRKGKELLSLVSITLLIQKTMKVQQQKLNDEKPARKKASNNPSK